MNLKNFTFVFAILMFPIATTAQQGYLQYVNPFIGTGGHGHTYPGATLPHGMVQLSPDTRLTGWDGCSGYHYSDTFIYGFTHTHLSGTGVSDYGDILLMPMNGAPSPDNKVYGSKFTHTEEKATPGYYSVTLQDDGIQAEMTATERTGWHHYTFSQHHQANLILDLKHRDEVIESSLSIEDSVTVTGMRRSKAWADNQYVFFVVKFSRAFAKNGMWQKDILTEDLQASTSNNIKAYFHFDSTAKEVMVKVAISAVSIEGAKRNMEMESAGWDFQETKQLAEQKWGTELNKIDIRSEDKEKLTVFYTALYHTAVVPNIYMDVDGQYRGRDNQVHKAEGFTYYSVFSLWDTYRAAHPLYTLIDPQRTVDYIKTFLAQYQQGGRLPVWELASCETDCMIGYHSIPVITDAYAKGITGFDKKLAWEAMQHSATADHRGLSAYIKKGFLETDDESESVSKTLEYAYDDWCMAIFARLTGNQPGYREYIKRAQNYKNVLDFKSGFMRPRKNGDWLSPFDPREVNNHFTEANSWQYSFYFPQDVGGYMALTGGAKKLEEKLDDLFSQTSQTTGRVQSDITGLLGQYAHGNEPSHHIIYLYNYTGKEFKTQEKVHKVMSEMYKNSPDGLIGNEDCGQMSAWYVLSALGFYPVTPGSTNYLIGTPQFPLAELHLENERSFIINSPGVSDTSFYIQSALLSTTASLMPKKMEASYFNHNDIANGGLVTFMMGSKPGTPFSKRYTEPEIKDKKLDIKVVMNPVIAGGSVPFKNTKRVTITSPQKNTAIYYTLDGKDPGIRSLRYVSPLLIKNTVTVKAISVNSKGIKSLITTANYKKNLHDYSVAMNTKYEPQYDGGGKDALIDGIHGSTDWHKGGWQGYQNADMAIVIDLKKAKRISRISGGFLQDTRAWIVLPREYTIEISDDDKNYRQIYKGKEFIPIENLEVQIMKIDPSFSPVTARYIRIKANQFGKLPAWHEGAGGDTHIFVDEIEVE